MRQLSSRGRTLAALFAAADGNRSNLITYQEFERGVAMVGVRPMPSTATLRRMFTRLDADRSNTISFNELNEAVLFYEESAASGPSRRSSPC